MRKKMVALVGATLLTLAALAPASAITKNYVKDFEHPFVGLAAFYDEAGDFSHRCSGSLLNPTVFLTAGHCTDNEAGGVMASARIWFQQDAGTRFDGVQDPVTGYPDACLAQPCATASEMYNYGFDNFAGFPDTHDAGIVILDTPIYLNEYGTLAPVGALDALLGTARGQKDTTFLASGYGLSYSSPVAFESFRERLMGFGKLTNLNSANTAGFNLQTNGNGKGNGATCSGDSGGPIFWPADTNQIVAVTSFGLNPWCRGVDFSYRVDTAAVQTWIDNVTGG
ncbi:MAG: trypsin-like serine protease [Candidatus Limnocylindria bacterium]